MVTLLQREIVAELGWNLEGLYLKGSLALGDFNPETSDIDLLALVKEPLAAEEFTRLARRHARIHSLPHRYAKEVELAYVPVGDVQRFQSGKAYPALERGERQRAPREGVAPRLSRPRAGRAAQVEAPGGQLDLGVLDGARAGRGTLWPRPQGPDSPHLSGRG